MLFSPSVQRPETIPGRVVGGLYTGNVAELLEFCFKKKKNKHILTSEEGWANLVELGETLIFLEMP